jgi:photosynthetic reaction center cytochrome c subunit
MPMPYRRAVPFARTALMVAVTFALLACFSAAQRGRQQPPNIKLKNIKVLKGLSAEQVIAIMRTNAASLGVQCDFCHVISADHTGWEKDDKKTKRIARQMMLMVKDINKREKILDGRATCFMCHRGNHEPVTKVQVPEGPRRR